MKKILSTAFAVLTAFSISAQMQFSDNVTLVSENNAGGNATFNVVVSCSGDLKDNDNILRYRAVTSVLNAIIFNGVPGFNNGQPLQPDASVAYDKQSFFDSFYGTDKPEKERIKNARCISYTNYNQLKKDNGYTFEEKNNTKTIRMTLTVYLRRLNLDLTRNGIIQPEEPEQPQETITPAAQQYTVMILPEKRTYQTYEEVWNDNPHIRNFIQNVSNVFDDKGFTVIDFDQTLQNEIISAELSYGTIESALSSILTSQGADVYVIVSVEGGQASMNAYQTSTGLLLASTPTRDIHRKNPPEIGRLLRGECLKPNGLIDKINTRLSQNPDLSVTLTVAIDENSIVSLYDKVDGDLTIADLIHSWLKRNTVNGKYHTKVETGDRLIFDVVPLKKDGDKMSRDYANELINYLADYGIYVNEAKCVKGDKMQIVLTD